MLLAPFAASSGLIEMERAVSAWTRYYESHKDVLTYTAEEAVVIRTTFQPADMQSFLLMLVSDEANAVSRKQAARADARERLAELSEHLTEVIMGIPESLPTLKVWRLCRRWMLFRANEAVYRRREAFAFAEILRRLEAWHHSQGTIGEAIARDRVLLNSRGYINASEYLSHLVKDMAQVAASIVAQLREAPTVSPNDLGAARDVLGDWARMLTESDLSYYQFGSIVQVTRERYIDAISDYMTGKTVDPSAMHAAEAAFVSIKELKERADREAPEARTQRLVELVFDACDSPTFAEWKKVRTNQLHAREEETSANVALNLQVQRVIRIEQTCDDWLLPRSVRDLRNACLAWVNANQRLAAANHALAGPQSSLHQAWNGIARTALSVVEEESLMDIEDEEAEDVEDAGDFIV